LIVEVTHYALVAGAAFWIAGLAAAFSWASRRQAPAARSLFRVMVAVAVWSAGAAVELTVTGVDAKVRWSVVEYLGTLSAPVFWVLFALDFARRGEALPGWGRPALWAMPVATWLLAATNDSHQLVWRGFHPSDVGFNLMAYERGPWFWIGVVGYSWLCLVAGTLIVLHSAFRSARAYRRGAVTVLVAVAIPWIANGLYIFGPKPWRGLDPTPLSLAAMGLVCVYAIVREHLLDLVPAAREIAVDRMSDGIVVCDADRRVVEANGAAARLLALPEMRPGAPLAALCARWPPLIEAAERGGPARLELEVGGDPPRTLEAELSPVPEPGGRGGGQLLVLRDVTERLRSERDQRETNRRLAAQLEQIEALQSSLLEQATRDALTGLFNRRYLDETMVREFARAERTREPLSVVLLDLDRFKDLNDASGHAAGDEVLRELGLLLRAHTRRADIACRYGGEEFLIAMPSMGVALALERAEELRAAFATVRFGGAATGLTCTLSAGVACFPEHALTLDGLLASADLALYAAKADGRNCVRLAAFDVTRA